jgi:hypothetical protein
MTAVRAGVLAMCAVCALVLPVGASQAAGVRCGGRVAKPGKQVSQVWSGGA